MELAKQYLVGRTYQASAELLDDCTLLELTGNTPVADIHLYSACIDELIVRGVRKPHEIGGLTRGLVETGLSEVETRTNKLKYLGRVVSNPARTWNGLSFTAYSVQRDRPGKDGTRDNQYDAVVQFIDQYIVR